MKTDNTSSTTIIETLAQDYECVNYIQLSESAVADVTENYRTSETLTKMIPSWSSEKNLHNKLDLLTEYFVFEEDKRVFYESTRRTNILNEIKLHNEFAHNFRALVDGKIVYYQVKIVPVKEKSVVKGLIFGIHSIDEQVREQVSHSEELFLQLKNFHNIIHSGMWSVEIDSDVCITDSFWSDEFRELLGFKNELEFPNVFDSWRVRVHPEDRKNIENVCYDYIKNYKENSIFEIEYRLLTKQNEYHWYHMAGTATAGKNENGKRIYGTLIDTTEKHTNDEMQKVIDILMNDFACVCCVNSDTQEDKVYKFVNSYKKYLNGWDLIHNFSDRIELICNSIVHEDDREFFRLATQSDKILEELKKNKVYYVDFRYNYDDKIEYWQLKFVSMDSETKRYIAGFHNIDVERRSEFEKNQFNDIATALSSGFEAIYYVNIEDNSFTEVVCQGEFKKIKTMKSGKKFFREAVKTLRPITYPDELNRIIYMFNGPDFYENLSSNRFISMEFRIQIDGNPVYYQLKVLRPGKKSKYIIVAVTNVDFEIKERVKYQEDLERNLEIIDILASEYSSVYYIDLNNDSLLPYTMNENTESKFGKIFNSGIHYSDAFKLYVEKFINEADREKMLDAGSIERIKEELAAKKTYVTIYRGVETGIPHYCEMKFVKLGDENSVPKAVALGFADKDEEIISKYIDMKLYEGFLGIYYCNLEQDLARIIKMDTNYANYEKGVVKCYSKEVKDYSKTVDEGYRGMWLNLSNVVYMRDFLSKDDRREYVYRNKNHEWIRSTFTVLERKNGVAVSFILAYDEIDASSSEKYELDEKISQQKDILEQQQVLLEQAVRKAEAASKAKTSFLSNMSHDIRTPMNAIIGFTTLAMTKKDNMEKVQGYLEKISVSSQHLLSLINDILDMSRIESGKITLSETECNLSDMMHDLKIIILGQAQAKQQHLFMQSYDIKDENVLCDKLRLHQVLINLLSNAIKFTPPGGNIELCIRQIASDENTASYDFTVRDDGIGMDNEFISKIFEPFEREYTSTISKTQGTGLGMSITKNIVDMMGGTIDVYSEQGKGSEFIVHLTLKKQAEFKETQCVTAYKNSRVLIVDDDYNSCASASEILDRMGLKSEWTLYGKEAILRAKDSYEKKEQYSMYFIDWVMSDMGGLEVVKQIREVVGNDVPIFVMSAYDWSTIEEEAREVGVTDFISKPLFYSEMNKIILKAAGNYIEDKDNDENSSDNQGKNILLVEDNELNREIAKEILENCCYNVDIAENGLIALEKVKDSSAETYDVILMDIQMPEMDGYEATRQIRSLPDKKKSTVPIIAMTANAFDEDRIASLNAGMNDHVAKPIDMGKLLNAIEKAIKNRKML